MFTGLVEEIGQVKAVKKGRNSSILTIQASLILSDLCLGDSVCVSGVCLTASALHFPTFQADVMHETLNRSSLGTLKAGSYVNLERAMPLGGRFGGHIVSGHIDGIGTIKSIRKDDNAIWYTIKTTNEILRYIVEKGSITVEGISLTVAFVASDSFSLSAIPHTVKSTILHDKKVGDTLNLENDMLGKYIEKLLGNTQTSSPPKGITRNLLERFEY